MIILSTIAVLAFMVTLVYLSYRNAKKLVYPTRRSLQRLPVDAGILMWENVTFKSSDDLKLKGWFVPATEPSNKVVICVHGLRRNRERFLTQAAFLHNQGYNVLLFDPRNHGESEGDTTSMALYEIRDVEAALSFIKKRLGEDLTIALMGHSMGAATVLRATSRLPHIKASIAISSYSSLKANIADGVRTFTKAPPFPLAPLIVWWCEYLTKGKVQDINPLTDLTKFADKPLLLIHGEADTVIRPQNSQRLYEKRPHQSQLIMLAGAGHNAVLSEPYFKQYKTELVNFLDSHMHDNATPILSSGIPAISLENRRPNLLAA